VNRKICVRLKKGYTLVETIVALSLSAMLFTSVISVIIPVYRVFARTRERADAQLLAGTILDSIRATCTNARVLAASEDGKVLVIDEKVALSLSDDGYLLYDDDIADDRKPNLVLASGVYNGKTIDFSCVQNEDSVVMTILVISNNETLADITSTLRSMYSVITNFDT